MSFDGLSELEFNRYMMQLKDEPSLSKDNINNSTAKPNVEEKSELPDSSSEIQPDDSLETELLKTETSQKPQKEEKKSKTVSSKGSGSAPTVKKFKNEITPSTVNSYSKNNSDDYSRVNPVPNVMLSFLNDYFSSAGSHISRLVAFILLHEPNAFSLDSLKDIDKKNVLSLLESYNTQHETLNNVNDKIDSLMLMQKRDSLQLQRLFIALLQLINIDTGLNSNNKITNVNAIDFNENYSEWSIRVEEALKKIKASEGRPIR